MSVRALAPLRAIPRWCVAFVLVAAVPGLAAAAEAPAVEAPDELVPPERIGEVTIEYPPELLEDPEPPEGEVVVALTIGTDGVPKDVRVVTPLHPRLDEAAVQLVQSLRYTPARWQGRPVEVEQELRIPYVAPKPEPPAEPPAAEAPSDPATGETSTPADTEPSEESSEASPEGSPDDDASPVRLSGTLLEAGVRTAIGGASVVAVPADPGAEIGAVKKKDYTPRGEPAWQAVATTDAAGRFDLRGRFAGKVRVVVLAPGYERIEFVESIPADQQIAVKYYAKRLSTNPYRTVVESEDVGREEVARRRITVEEINAVPGTQGDALKSIQNFPGVARSPFGIGFLAIRGTGPNDSAIYLGHHEIPTLFHFGGLTSVFNSDILERIDFVPGNFDSRYGDAIGGIIDVEPRAGRRDGYHGYVDSDVFDTGVLVEGPIGKGSFALSGRRSYIDLILPFVIPDDAGLDLTIAPRYYDYQALFDHPLGGGDFSVRVFGSDDRTKLVASDPNEVEEDDRDRFETKSWFHRFDLVYEKKKGPWKFLMTPSYRLELLQLGIGGFLNFDLRTHNLSVRAEVERRIGKRHSLRVGTETIGTWYRVDVTAPPVPDGPGGGSTGAVLATSIRDAAATYAVYSTLSLGLAERFTLFPGVRAGLYTLLDEGKSFVDPRLNAAWDVADRTTLKAGVGLYTQAPQAVQQSAAFGNPRLWLQRGLQTSVGVQQEMPYDIDLDATVFWNNIFDQPTASPDVVRRPDGTVGAELFANTQRGRVYGGEILLRKQLTGSFFGWVAYTLSRSERRAPPDDEWRLFDFDQTHILTLIGVVRLPKNWQLGARFRLVSGNPYTPVAGSTFDAATGGYLPVNAAVSSGRLPLFHQLDLRVDKRWIWRLVSLTLYLDVQNVYNHQNTEFWNYAYDFSARRPIAGLPIIPSIGTKLEF